MSKSFNNYIALNEAPNEMYGKMMSAKDEVIVEYFTLLTDRNLEEITEMEKEITSGANPMEFKKLLAHDLVTFYHNSDAADEAAKHFEATVQNKQLPDDMPDLKIPDGEIALQDLVKLAVPDESMSNIRRLIDQGGVELIDSEDSKILRVGKRKFFKLVD
jgi:tyrosyl-tRNA synthetase